VGEQLQELVVGVNAFADGNEDHQVEILQIPHTVEQDQCDRLTDFRRERDADAARRGLDEIRRAARDEENVMPALIEAVTARCTIGEMVQALGDVFGRYTSGPEW